MIELLCVVAVIVILAAILLPATVRTLRHCKAWAWGVWGWSQNRLDVFVNDEQYPERIREHYLLTNNHPHKWSFVQVNPDGTVKIIK